MDIFGSAYPNFYKSQTSDERLNAAKLWAAMFVDDDFETVLYAVKSFIVTDEKGFPPVIGVVKNKIADLQNRGEMTEYEAWNTIKKAISNGYYGAADEFAGLPPILQRLVGSPNRLKEWATMETEQIETVMASNFMRSYRARAEHEREQLMMPADVKNFIAAMSERMKLPAEPKQLTEQEINERRDEIRRQLENGK